MILTFVKILGVIWCGCITIFIFWIIWGVLFQKDDSNMSLECQNNEEGEDNCGACRFGKEYFFNNLTQLCEKRREQ